MSAAAERWVDSSELNAWFEAAVDVGSDFHIGRQVTSRDVSRALEQRRERRQRVHDDADIPTSFAGFSKRPR